MPSRPVEELVRICAERADQGSWEELIRRIQPVIASTVLRTARRFRETSRDLMDDLVQETLLRICENRCRILREFHSEHPDAIFGLLKSVAFSVTQDHFRAELAAKRGAGKAGQPMDTYADSTLASPVGLPAIERRILLNEIDAYLAANSVESETVERWIFWLYYRHGMTTRAIAAIPGIGLKQKGVESLIHRLTGRVRTWLTEKAPGGEGNPLRNPFY